MDCEYYKANYPRLQRIKAQWGPGSVFRHALSIRARGFSIEERFVRDAHGQVVGIVYSMGDSEIEASRVP